MWSERTLRRTGLAATLVVALATAPVSRPPALPGEQVLRDAFTTTAHEVTQRRAAGEEPVCWLRAAVWEPHRPDAGRFPPAVRGEPIGLFGDRWLDIRRWDALAAPLGSRLQLCREKGFEAVRFDNDWGHPAGFGLTSADWKGFADRVGELAGGHGLAVVPSGVPH